MAGWAGGTATRTSVNRFAASAAAPPPSPAWASGWYCCARRKYASLVSSGVAPGETPSTRRASAAVSRAPSPARRRLRVGAQMGGWGWGGLTEPALWGCSQRGMPRAHPGQEAASPQQHAHALPLPFVPHP